MGNSDLGVRLGIEGEKQFKDSLRDINQAFKVLGSEMQLVTAQYDKSDKSTAALTSRNTVLNKEIDSQKEKIATLRAALENAATSFGENDRRTQSWQIQLNKAEAELIGMERELKQNEKALDGTSDGLEEAEKGADEYGGAVKDAGAETEKSSGKMETLGKVAKGIGAALAAAVVAVGAAIGAASAKINECVEVYAGFEDSMMQVAATMGMTAEEIAGGSTDFKMLEQAAKEAGANTRFAASEAAEALNYLALAGYDAEQATAALPGVLNLAAAGGMALGQASDMVTDSMGALKMQTSEMGVFMDQMAKASQKSNTSVKQLGEATLVCAGTVNSTGQSLTTMNTALGILADNGVKGAEGGTHLRNVLLSLASPTDKAAATLKDLGVSVYDNQGNMRDLGDVMTDLNKELGSLSQEERTNALSNIFNKTDLNSVNFLLEGTNGRFKELSGLIEDSAGAATSMAETMEAGLAGTERSFASAVEGMQIEIGGLFADIKKGFLEDATGVIRTFTGNLQAAGGDWSKVADAVGQLIQDAMAGLSKQIPKFIEIGKSALTALLKGITDNLPALVSGATELIDALLKGIIQALPQIMQAAVQLVLGLVDGIIQNLPALIEAAVQMVVVLVDGIAAALPQLIPQAVEAVLTIVRGLLDNLPMLIEAALGIVLALAEGIADSLPQLVKAIPQILSSIVSALIGALPLLLPAAIDIIFALIDGLIGAIPELVAAIPNLIIGIVAGIIDNLPTIILAGPEIIIALITGLIGAIPELIMALPRVIMSIVDTFREYDWASMGRNLIDGLIGGIGNMIEKVKEKIREVGQKIVAEFKSFFGINSPSTVFAGFGKNLLEGLWNGIQDIKDWLIGKLRGLGSAITDAIKSVFGISSPSKVFRDQIGQNLALGLGEGFEAAMKDVSRDMQDAVPTDFDINTNVKGAMTGNLAGAGGGFSLVLNIGTFINNSVQDLRQLADELSTIMAGEIRRKEILT